jgi:hypothetical protein
VRDRPLPFPDCDWDNPRPSTAVPLERFNTIEELLSINKTLTNLVKDTMSGDGVAPTRWETLAEDLARAERLCRTEAKPVVLGGEE